MPSPLVLGLVAALPPGMVPLVAPLSPWALDLVSFAPLAPLAWALAGLLAVIRLTRDERRRQHADARPAVGDDFDQAASARRVPTGPVPGTGPDRRGLPLSRPTP